MLLTPDELVVLTAEERNPARRRVPDALGIPHKARPDGSLVGLCFACKVALCRSIARPS